jgi:Flp pilus assembly protein TadB
MIFVMALFIVAFALPQAQAGAVVPAAETGVVPSSKEKAEKNIKKQIKEVRKEFRTEMKGMNKAEKKAFVEDKIGKNQLDIPNLKWLIIGLVLLLIGAIFYIIPGLNWLAYIIQSIGGIIIIIWLILWLLELA